MIEITILIISLLTLIASACLYRIASGEAIWHLNMLSYSFYILFALSFVASVVIVLDVPFLGFNPQDNPELFGDLNNRLFVWGMVMWMFIGIPLGAIVVNIIFSRSLSISEKMKEFRASEYDIGLEYTDRSLYKIVFIASALLALIFFITMPREVPLLHVLSGGSVVEGQIIRSSFHYGFDNVLLKSLFNDGTLLLLSLVAFIISLRTGQRKWWLLFSAQFLILIFLSISKGTVGHILYYMIALAFCRKLNGGKFVKLHEMLLAALLVAGLFIMFKGAEGSLWQILTKAVFSRAFFSQLGGLYYTMQIFPDVHDFLWLSSTGRLLNTFFTGTSSESYGIILMSYYTPEGVAAGSAGHFTSIFLAEAWANFGIFGIIAAPLWVGIFVQLVNRFFLKRPNNVIFLAFYVYLATTFGYASDFMGFYYPVGTIMFVLGASLIFLFPKQLMQISKKNKSIVKSKYLHLEGGGY